MLNLKGLGHTLKPKRTVVIIIFFFLTLRTLTRSCRFARDACTTLILIVRIHQMASVILNTLIALTLFFLFAVDVQQSNPSPRPPASLKWNKNRTKLSAFPLHALWFHSKLHAIECLWKVLPPCHFPPVASHLLFYPLTDADAGSLLKASRRGKSSASVSFIWLAEIRGQTLT